MPPIVEVAGAVKRYRDVHALQGVDVVLDSGRAHALLGPNGAGKTTLVRMLATLLAPDAGAVRVAGFDVVRQARQVRQMIGLAGKHAAVEPAMTGRENLQMVGRLCGQGADGIAGLANPGSHYVGLAVGRCAAIMAVMLPLCVALFRRG